MLRRCRNCKKYFDVWKPSSKQECCSRECSREFKRKQKKSAEYIAGTVDRINNHIRDKWMEVFTDVWNQIALFEAKEVKAWKNAKPIQQEARACERMKAYVILAERLADMECAITTK